MSRRDRDRGVERIDITDVFRLSKSKNMHYVNFSKLAKPFGLKRGDKLRITIKEKMLDTYEE